MTETETNETETEFDIVIVCDFRLPGGTSTALANEIRTFSDAGLKIGILQLNSTFLESTAPIHPEILSCVESRLATFVPHAQNTKCNLLALHNPTVFERVKLKKQRIRSRNRIMVAHHVPLSPTGRLNYNPWRLNRAIKKAFGGDFYWAPISPVCRNQFKNIAFNLKILADDWHSIVRVQEWGAPRSCINSVNFCVIGRHSRPGRDKWPLTKEEILLCYPSDSDFKVRILGADDYLKKLVWPIPNNWRLFAFNEITPKQLLSSIDFFVYFHHPLTMEAFGRAPAEAAASGCVLILPRYLEKSFYDGAIYCEPHDVAAIVRALCSDPNAYSTQSKQGYEVVRQRYGPESLLALAQATMSRPKLDPSEEANWRRSARGAFKRFLLRTGLAIRKTASFAKALIKKLRRSISRRLPTRLRVWAWQRLSDRRTSRSPDRAILQKKLFPGLIRAGALSLHTKVLWIGCRRYTKKYYSAIESSGAKCWSIDIDPEMRIWGRDGRHVTGDMLDLDKYFPSEYFDVVLCNGILGWGVDSAECQARAFAVMASVMKPGAWLLVGWNTDRILDPLSFGFANQWFEHTSLADLKARYVVRGCTHIYDTFRRLAH